MAPLRYAAKFDPFLSLDCARVEGVGAQSKFCHLATLMQGANIPAIHSAQTSICCRFSDGKKAFFEIEIETNTEAKFPGCSREGVNGRVQ